MSKPKNVFLSSVEACKTANLDLKDWRLAALLGWLVPGLGHFYQGRNTKGAIFSICIGSLLVFGIYVGQGNGQTTPDGSMVNVIYAPAKLIPEFGSFEGIMDSARFLGQSGVGGVALPSLVQRHRAQRDEPTLGPLFSPPDMQPPKQDLVDGQRNLTRQPNELARWHYEAGHYFELGAVYTVIAGLLNILAVYDAAAGPLLDTRGLEEEGDSEEKAQEEKSD